MFDLHTKLPHLPLALADAASPDRALTGLERFLQAHPRPATVLDRLAGEPHTLELLITLFACSQHLTDILLRHPDRFNLLADRKALAEVKDLQRFLAEAWATVAPWLSSATRQEDVAAGLDALRRFQRCELLRIGVADLGGLLELASVTTQLSHLADAVIQTALALVAGTDAPAGLTVLGLGKLGGRELNYSSDVDLLFLAADASDEALSQQRRRLAERLIFALSQATAEGFLYRVDMRLRPWGRAGPLVTTVGGYLAYLERNARLWERQALLKARAVAGDLALGADFLRRIEPLLFDAGSEAARTGVHNMKLETEAHLRRTGRAWGDVKLGEGSIRDAEFVAQYLQLAHGCDRPELRTPNTREALARLSEAGLLSPEDHRVLAEGYTFLRTVEHYLQILDYRQTHTLPADPADLRYLARRLGFQSDDAAARFIARYQLHSQAVRAVYLRHLTINEQQPATATGAERNQTRGEDAMTAQTFDAGRIIKEHLARLAPSYLATFDPVEVEHHAIMAAQLDASNPILVDAQPLPDGRWRVTIVGYDYLGILSVICGLLFAYGFNIADGHVYTYEPAAAGSQTRVAREGQTPDARRKIVDVFQVFPVEDTRPGPETWAEYRADLLELVRLLQAHERRLAQGELAKRVAQAVRAGSTPTPALPPVDIEIDNDASPEYTVLRISATDTPGFLYEFTNALALNGIHISQVFVASAGNRVQDVLLVTDARGNKIVAPERQRELRAATALVKHFTHLLPRSPNPEAALLHFHEYLGELFSRPSWPDELASLERPEVLDALARLLGVSEFLWDDFLRMQYENLFPVVADVEALRAPKRKVELAAELLPLLNRAGDPGARRAALNAFKDREMFRIDMRHILGYIRDFDTFSMELTDLVETVVAATARMVYEELVAVHGTPLGAHDSPIPLAVCVLGKCGGFELGYASDIEVMFIYGGGGETAGPRIISAAEFFDKVVAEFSRAVWARREGIFEIDLDLRPYGKAGSLSVPLDAFRRYFAPDGPAWAYERQALIKLRAVAGDPDLGRHVEALRDVFIYHPRSFDLAAMRAMRERQLRHLVTPGTFNAKYSLGGLVDVEYTVQGLQMRYGGAKPALRLTNTRAAITALASHGVISAENALRLREAHLFLQQLINALRVVRGNSKDLTVPAEGTEEFAFLARRLAYGHDPGRLSVALRDHTAWVQRLAERLLG